MMLGAMALTIYSVVVCQMMVRLRASALKAEPLVRLDGVAFGRPPPEVHPARLTTMLHVRWSALGQTKSYEYAIRFGLGGIATVLTGLIADRFGPETRGFFLAFPAIFFARVPPWSKSTSVIKKAEKDCGARSVAGWQRHSMLLAPVGAAQRSLPLKLLYLADRT